MMTPEDELKRVFIDEAKQLLAEAEAAIIELESGKPVVELLKLLSRLIHNFKGSAQSVGFDGPGALAHAFEDVLIAIKSGEQQVSKETTSVLLRALDELKAYMDGLEADLSFTKDVTSIRKELDALKNGRSLTPKTEPQARVLAPAQTASTPPPPPHGESTVTADENIRINARKLDVLINLVGELVVQQSLMNGYKQRGTTATPSALEAIGRTGKLVDAIRDLALTFRMIPSAQLFQKLKRAGRDVAALQGKEVEMITEGEHVELDKVIIEQISDPLTHLIRNAVDHGVEAPVERMTLGKPSVAKIMLKAEQKDGLAVITVSDDGRGMNPEILVKKAIKAGLIPEGSRLTDTEAYALIFKSGFTTKEEVTDISGRGVGMDVVKDAIEAMKGSIDISTALGKGTTFTIELPLSVSIIAGLVVRVNLSRYVIPISQLSEVVEFGKFREKIAGSSDNLLNLRGEVIPVVSLAEAMGEAYSPVPSSSDRRQGIITNYRGKKLSFEVDEILGQSQVVVKMLGGKLHGLPGIVAGAILSDGEPGLILDLHQLANSRNQYAA
jgi:two-component system chemotaxis sensor kinase CheA